MKYIYDRFLKNQGTKKSVLKFDKKKILSIIYIITFISLSYPMTNFEKMVCKFLAAEVSMLRVGLPVLVTVLGLQLYGLKLGVILL